MTVIFQSFALIFLLTLRAKKRILFQFCILSYHSTSFASADWTEYPFPFIHNSSTFSDITFYTYVITYISQTMNFDYLAIPLSFHLPPIKRQKAKIAVQNHVNAVVHQIPHWPMNEIFVKTKTNTSRQTISTIPFTIE